jgi:hypothetical protein
LQSCGKDFDFIFVVWIICSRITSWSKRNSSIREKGSDLVCLILCCFGIAVCVEFSRVKTYAWSLRLESRVLDLRSEIHDLVVDVRKSRMDDSYFKKISELRERPSNVLPKSCLVFVTELPGCADGGIIEAVQFRSSAGLVYGIVFGCEGAVKSIAPGAVYRMFSENSFVYIAPK